MNPDRLKSSSKRLLKFGCLFYLLLPVVCVSCYWLVFDYAIMLSWIGGDDIITHSANDMLGNHGDEITAFHLIASVREMEPPANDENHIRNIARLYERHPAERQAYLAYIVSGILESDRHHNRVLLIRTLEELTGEDFGYYMRGGPNSLIPDEAKPQIARGLVNVRRWWLEHNSRLEINSSLCDDDMSY